MKKDIHPEYMECTVTCSCGNTFKTRSTKPELKVDICNECHPFFTGQQKLVDTGGRVQRFEDRFGNAKETLEAKAAEKKAARAAELEAAETERKAKAEEKAAEKEKRAKAYEAKAKKEAAQKAKEEAEKPAEEKAEEQAPAEGQAP
ncbi:MAG: 50S ribosomal protein L31, partial [Coriobacteriia bacterium]|nr:50S ribosomal protein L31 [Coriobacteriia bacterium]